MLRAPGRGPTADASCDQHLSLILFFFFFGETRVVDSRRPDLFSLRQQPWHKVPMSYNPQLPGSFRPGPLPRALGSPERAHQWSLLLESPVRWWLEVREPKV